jgi:uncharacterized repeat protein (TIGR01451 family)
MGSKRKSHLTIVWGIIAFLAACLLTEGNAMAAGTVAGTTITNTASVSYQILGEESGAVSVSASFRVDRVISVIVTKKSDVNTAPTSTNVAVSFLVTNTSNTSMRFALSAVSKPTNTWTMNNVRIYRDNNGSASWDAGDTLYNDAGTFGDLASDASITVLIVADAPAGVTIGQAAAYDLVATAVDAATFGVSSVSILVSLNKTVTILDQWGGNLTVPGATLRYTIVETAAGGGAANNVVFSDPLPANTTYIANTLRLDNAALTDAADADAGDVGGTTADAVTVKLGNLTSASPAHTITFDVKIK